MNGLKRHGFTLLELLIVIGIMGLLGTVSVSGFRGIRSGIEQRATIQVVDEFVRSAYRRAIVDRAPTAVYFWNETISDESFGEKKLVVVGRAVAVARAGRISELAEGGKVLVDEYGDLAYDTYTDEKDEGEEDEEATDYDADQDVGRYLYKVGDTAFKRSVVSSSTVAVDNHTDYLMSRPGQKRPKIRAYGYNVRDANGVSWKVGDAYGFEIAELTLPKNFIFGTAYSEKASDPEKPLGEVMVFTGEPQTVKGLGHVEVAGLQLDDNGKVAFSKIGQSEDPWEDR